MRRERGNALIEMVLVLPVFLTLLLGVIDWGWYFIIREVAVNATRHGARVGSVASTTTLACSTAATAASTYLANSLGASYAGTPATTPATTTPICDGVTCISVSLTNYPTVPSRPTSSITGLNSWTRVPVTVTVTSEMRLENQP